MVNTLHFDLEKLPTGPFDWQASFNANMDKIEAGRTLKLVTGETINEYKVWRVASDGKAWLADGGEFDYLGLWQTTTTVGNTGFGQVEGNAINGSWAWVPGTLLYVNGSADLTATIPEQNYRPIAIAITATAVFILPFVSREYGVKALTTTPFVPSRIDDVINCDTTSNAIDINLPDASTLKGHKLVVFLSARPGTNNVTVDCSSGDYFDSGSTNNRITLDAVEEMCEITPISDNRWYMISNSGTLGAQ